MSDQPPNQDPGAEQPRSQDTTRRDSEAMLRRKPPQDPLIGTQVDQYSIKRVIGEGGMGVVYEALQQSPRRTVALKMMKRGVTSKSAMRRFEYEAQTLGRLRHDGIAQIYQAGTWDDGTGGRPWFAMEYLQAAKPLTQYCKDKKLGTRERLDIFSKVCAAVQHGHAKGIIHRDLKPGNILVTSSGVPKVIDFGVARSTDSDLAVTTLQTDVGALIGTLQYMSPEQCDADPNDIDIRSDVYALGVVLYELLCDQPPYALRHAAIHEAARIIREEEPTKPSSLDKRLRGDIETIAMKALEKDRDRRYQTAVELEQDIERYLDGEAISARRPTAWYHLKRFSQRHKAVVIMAASFVLLLLVATGISLVLMNDAINWRAHAQRNEQHALKTAAEAREQEGIAQQAQAEAERQAHAAVNAREEAQQERDSAIEARDEAGRQAYFGNIQAAAVAIEREYGSSANQRLIDARMAKGTPPISELPFEWQYLNAQSNHATRTLGDPSSAPSSKVRAIAFSPDGTRLASGGSGSVQLWDTETGEELTPLIGHTGNVGAITFSPDGTRLATGGFDDTIHIWDPRSGEVLLTLIGHERIDRTVVKTITYSPDGTRLAAGHSDSTIRLWDLQTGEELAVVIGDEDWHIGGGRDLLGSEIAFSPDSSRLASGSKDNSIHILDTATGNEVIVLPGHKDGVMSVTFSPDGTQLVSIGYDDTIRIWDLETGEELGKRLWQEAMDETDIMSITFSPDGGQFAVESWDDIFGFGVRTLAKHRLLFLDTLVRFV